MNTEGNQPQLTEELQPNFSSTFQKENLERIKRILEQNDSMTFLCMPGVGKQRTARYIALNENVKKDYFPNYDGYYFDAPQISKDFGKELAKILAKAKETNRKAYIVIDSFDELISQKDVLKIIQSYTFQYEHLLNIISFTAKPGSILYPKDISHITNYSFIYQNVLYLGEMSERDMKIFLNVWKRRFKVNISNKGEEQILKIAGANQTLLIITIRMLGIGIISEEDLFNPSTLLHKVPTVRFFFHKFMYHLGDRLMNKVTTQTYHGVEEFNNLGIVNTKGEYFSPLFTTFLSEYWNIDDTYECSDLTEQEQSVFKLLRTTPNGNITTREDISKVLWGREYAEKYSDWAIEKVIQNIRKKLKKQNIETILRLNMEKDII